MDQTVTSAKTLARDKLCATPTFSDASPVAVAALVEESELLTLPAGETLFQSGEKYRDRIYMLVEGDILVQRNNGHEDLLRPGDFIGLANYIDHSDYHSTVHAATGSLLLVTESTVMSRLEHTLPDIFNALNRIIADKLRERSPDRSISTGVLAQPVTRIMKSPVAFCGPGTSLREAFLTMKERRIGSMVVKEEDGKLLGLITYIGLAEAALLEHAGPDDSVSKLACEVPQVVESDTPLWEAEDLMERNLAKYAIVCEGDAPVGIVSKTDILQLLVSRPRFLSNRIRDTHTISDLAALSGKLAGVAVDASETNRRPSAAIRVLSETHLMLQRRAVELTLEWMKHKGYDKPPADYAVLIMGSGGRREMLLDPDQDNGIIIGETPADRQKQTGEWFERFGRRLNKNLAKVGYALCPGEIMAQNPMFRQSLAEWKQQISAITTKPSAKAARWANVVLDFDTLYGKDTLASELRRHLLDELRRKPGLLKSMAEDDAEGKPALGIFNQLITTRDEKGEHIDVKRNGLRIIADAARIFALQNGIAVQNTSDRLSALVRVGKLSDDFKDSVQEAYEEMLDLLLGHQIKQALAGKELNKKIKLDKLSPGNRAALRMAMRVVKRFQDQLHDEYSGEVF